MARLGTTTNKCICVYPQTIRCCGSRAKLCPETWVPDEVHERGRFPERRQLCLPQFKSNCTPEHLFRRPNSELEIL